ncbi:site-specific DNA-methyltransferase [Caballeronia zhejiangensis]|nr:site-specific DNA-methyltransferase [Caballeronia zhejiangensis]
MENAGIIPSGRELSDIARAADLDELELRLRLGCFDRDLVAAIRKNAGEVAALLRADALPSIEAKREGLSLTPVFETQFGTLYNEDCIQVLANLPDDSVDLIFADPPFNLNKLYPSGIDDNLKADKYLDWCEEWIIECSRVLRPGGSFFLWNIPRWSALLASIVSRRLRFQNWISVDMKYGLPISGRLYPAHYALLYFVKGERPLVFKPDRLSLETCPACFAEIKDYGGYKHKMNPAGVSLSDVWHDIPPVRHAKYKRRKDANELSIKLIDRILEMSSKEGDLILDPFGGSGTTYVVAEIKKRRWIGTEVGPVEGVIERLEDVEAEAMYLSAVRAGVNHLFPPTVLSERIKRGLWTPESERQRKTGQAKSSGN